MISNQKDPRNPRLPSVKADLRPTGFDIYRLVRVEEGDSGRRLATNCGHNENAKKEENKNFDPCIS